MRIGIKTTSSWRSTLLLGLPLLFMGCGSSAEDFSYQSDKNDDWEIANESSQPPIMPSYSNSYDGPSDADGGNSEPPIAEAQVNNSRSTTSPRPTETNTTSPKRTRQIIYDVWLQLAVESLDGVEQRIQTAVNQHNGFISSALLDTNQGRRRTASWTVRVPVDQYEQFITLVSELGVPKSKRVNAEDVTEQFVDLEARLVNKKKLEKRILDLLDQTEDEIKNVIEVERELSRVREEVERIEGRLRYLSDKSALTTVEISVREEVNFVVPQAIGFGQRIGNAWRSSWANFRTGFENFSVRLVENIFGFVFSVLALIVFWFFLRKRIYKAFKGVFRPSE